MLKADLKQLWGSYCDTDKLVDDVRELLTKYHHDNTEHGVCEMLNVYFGNKKHLINMFMKSDNYIGDMRICLDVEMERRNNRSEIDNFCSAFPQNVGAREVFLKYVDEFGKTLDDYLRVGISGFKARSLYYGNIAERLVVNTEHKAKFNRDGSTKESHNELEKFASIMGLFGINSGSTLAEDIANCLTQYKINGTFVSGMKTSRAFNRVCSYYKVDKLPNYNKLFAQYADMVSGLKRKVKFYISLNPLDYLTMSFGNSWASCHTIDKENKRNMPSNYSGMYCGGCVSYMLDHTSIITYVHNYTMEHYEDGKVYRNMFHYADGILVQGRVYPQGNDGATDLYQEFRSVVQGELAKMLGVENAWIKKKGGCCDNTISYGVHYRDYLNYGGCNVTYPREMPESVGNAIIIGHERICPNCGLVMSDGDDAGYLTHDDCEAAANGEDW